MTPATKLGREVVAGDVISLLSTAHRVAAIEDYDTSAYAWGEPGTRIASAADGWSITLFPRGVYEIV